MFFLLEKNKKQLKSIFIWLSNIVQQNDLILLDQKGKQTGYYFEFPLKIGDRPKKIKSIKNKNFTFIIRILPTKQTFPKGKWQIIFQSPEIEIYENRERFQFLRIKSLRWGLTKEERSIALKIARQSLEIFLKEKIQPKPEDLNLVPLSPLFTSRTDLDVALWTKGIIRGSAVVENKNFRDGLIEGAVQASRDSRFKPLKLKELPQTRIEITLISDLRIPLSEDLIKKDEIFYNKGYLIKKGQNKGWFLPEVFNVRLFNNLREFLGRLASEKASLSPEAVFDKKTEIFIFEVEDFIEGTNQEEALKLDGPTIKFKKRKDGLEKLSLKAADWLLKIQETDGNFPPIINPLTGQANQIDWPRSAMAAWSLVELAKTIEKANYLEAAKKNFLYLKKYLLGESLFIANYNQTAASLAYFGQLALSLDYWQESLQAGSGILEKERHLDFEPILFQQIGSFFTELAKSDKRFFEPALRFADSTKDVFTKILSDEQPINLAVWAEVVNLFLKLFEMTDNHSYLETAQKTTDWLLKYQLNSGAFKSATNSNFVYTRGTAKIAEVLGTIFLFKNKEIDKVFNLNYCRKCLEKTFDWVSQMQYSLENSYFIPQDNLKLVIGGIRHDYFNSELWIDSVGHLLLGASRYLR